MNETEELPLKNYKMPLDEKQIYILDNSDKKWKKVLMKNETISKKRSELAQLFIEAQEYDFLLDKIPAAVPDYWEEED